MTSQPPPSTPISGASAFGGYDNTTPDDELLVAYLDGELDKGSASEVEIKLASDAALRRRLNDLRVAWDLLEELPPAEPNPRFAQSTIEMVAMKAASLSDAQPDRQRRWRWAAAVLALVPIMFGVGYAVVRAAQWQAERQALEVVHVLADWEALEYVGSYDWLQKIRSVPNLGRVAKRSANSGLENGLVPPTIAQREAWIETLSAPSRDRLSANLVAFKRASPAERQRILELARQIYEGPDPLGDLQAARDYSHFLSEMSNSDRADHHDQKDEALRLDDLMRRVNRRMVEVYTQDLTPNSPDRQAVAMWINDMKDQYGSALGRGGVTADLMRGLMFPGSNSVISEDDLDNLLASLTPEAQEIIGRIRSKEAQHQALIFYFINDAQPFFPGRGPRRQVDRAQLTKTFESLQQSRKDLIEFLPPERAQERLGMRNGNDSRGGSSRAGNGFAPPFDSRSSTPSTRSQMRDEAIEGKEMNSSPPPTK